MVGWIWPMGNTLPIDVQHKELNQTTYNIATVQGTIQ